MTVTPEAEKIVQRVRSDGRENLIMVLGTGCCDSTSPFLYDNYLPEPDSQPVAIQQHLQLVHDDLAEDPVTGAEPPVDGRPPESQLTCDDRQVDALAGEELLAHQPQHVFARGRRGPPPACPGLERFVGLIRQRQDVTKLTWYGRRGHGIRVAARHRIVFTSGKEEIWESIGSDGLPR